MRVVIQRVTRAQASPTRSSNVPIASIEKGLVLLCGFEESDTPVSIEQMAQKIRSLRIFSDDQGKLNLGGAELGAQYLLVSQFTLYAECKYGNRPSFEGAASKPKAKEYFEHFVKAFSKLTGPENTKSTPFGSDLLIELVNDGPVTIWLDSTEVL